MTYKQLTLNVYIKILLIMHNAAAIYIQDTLDYDVILTCPVNKVGLGL